MSVTDLKETELSFSFLKSQNSLSFFFFFTPIQAFSHMNKNISGDNLAHFFCCFHNKGFCGGAFFRFSQLEMQDGVQGNICLEHTGGRRWCKMHAGFFSTTCHEWTMRLWDGFFFSLFGSAICSTWSRFCKKQMRSPQGSWGSSELAATGKNTFFAVS